MKRRMKKFTIPQKIEVSMRFLFITMTSAAIIFRVITLDRAEDEWEGITSLFIALILFFIPTIFSKRTKIKIPVPFQIFFLIFVYFAMYLGEVYDYYYKFYWWDSLLHLTSSLMLAYIGFLLIFALNKDKNAHMNLSPFFMALFTFCFAMACAAIWEIFEFLVDEIFNVNMQKARNLCTDSLCNSRTGVMDTMSDLVEGAVGALIVSVIGFYYCKKKMIQDNVFWKLKDQFIEENPNLFDK